MAQVNSVHVKGYGLDNTTGIEFFTGESINDMAVNEFGTKPENWRVESA